MRVAILADTHAGARNDSPKFDAHFKKFYDEVFFPHILKEGIDTIIHLGDVFDRRKYVNFHTLQSVRSYFFDKLVQHDLKMYVIAGNHDTYFKNTNQINSIRLLLNDYIDSGHIILFDTEAEERIIGGKNFHFIPWICHQTEESAVNMMRRAEKTDICIGHFELDGYQMFQGIRNEGGMDRKLLGAYDMVLTGHFHTRSHEDNVYYLGSPYEYTWSDFDDPRGFHILETKDSTLEFIENPFKMFHKIYYYEDQPLPQPENYAGCCVKIYVMQKTNFERFEQFIDALYQQNVEELTIHEDLSDFSGGDISDDKLDMEDTMALLEGFVDATDSDKDKNRIKGLLKELFIEASSLEV